MRIGLLTTSYPTHDHDIAGHFVRGFAEALADVGHQVEVLAPAPQRASEAPPRHLGVTLHEVRYAVPRSAQALFYGAGVPENLTRHPHLAPLLATFSAALLLESRRRAARWDAVVSHWALPCALVASQLPLPHLAVCHSADVHALQHLPFGKALRRHIQHRARAMWFVSPEQRNRFIVTSDQPPPRIYAGPMGIAPFPHTARSRGARLRVATLSRLVPVKGLEHAIRAVRQLPDVELHIAGDGPSRIELEHQARDCNRIRMVGSLSGQAKLRFLQEADAFALPSIVLPDGRSEGVPCALLEAMSAGLPVIASDVGGVGSVVQHGRNGLLVQPGNASSISRALHSIQSAPNWATELGQNARTDVECHSWPRLAAVAESLLAGMPLPQTLGEVRTTRML